MSRMFEGSSFIIPQVLCWQLDSLDYKLDFRSSIVPENLYLDCSCVFLEKYNHTPLMESISNVVENPKCWQEPSSNPSAQATANPTTTRPSSSPSPSVLPTGSQEPSLNPSDQTSHGFLTTPLSVGWCGSMVAFLWFL